MRDFHGSPVADSMFPMQGAWVQPLVRELDTHARANDSTTRAQHDQTNNIFKELYKKKPNLGRIDISHIL